MTAGSTTNTHDSRPPRVFISYARSDGEKFATDLRQRLLAEHIPLWQDRVGMEGSKDWWQQISEALDKVEFMVLIMTPAAMQSEMVRKEWRYARQRGVCVYPVKGVPNLDFNSLPHWMRSAHCYDLDYEWPKFLNNLNTRCQQPRVPFMVEDLPPEFVRRPKEFDALIEKLMDQNREEPVAITAALRGAGGYGKTTMARALCHDERIQQAFDDGILWVTLGEHPTNMVSIVVDVIETLSGTRPGFTGIDAAATRTIRLHDVIRSYLQHSMRDALPALHAQLLDAYALTRWADLPDNEPYLWDHLAEHLLAARRPAELVITVKDLRYLARKTLLRTAYPVEADLALAEQRAPDDVPLRLLKRNVANMGHLLNRCRTYPDLAATLYSRLEYLPDLSHLCRAFEPDIARPFLASWHPLPDPALIRTLSGHTNKVTGSAISAAGDFIVSASYDQTLKLWDAHTGKVVRTLRGHTDTVNGCAISPAGDFIVSASKDETLNVWDARTGACLSTFYVNGSLSACAFHPDGQHLVAVGTGGVYFLHWVR
jgi:hypothetical protein